MQQPAPTTERAYPLTSAQQRLFFLHQLDTDAAMYVFPVHLELRGPLDVLALERALADVVRRHEILRSVIEVRDQRPVQVVRDDGTELRHLDLRGYREADRARRQGEAVERETNAPFDFSSALMRSLLVHRGDEDYLLLLSFHHIVFDGWSCGVLLGELDEGYRRHRGEPTAPAQPLALQYGEYAAREARDAATPGVRTQEAFWQQKLTPVPENLVLPTDRPRPAALSGRARRTWTYLDADLTAALGLRSRELRATVYMLLLASYEVLLARLGGRSDFCVGGATSGRHDLATHPMIGSLVNELVYRSDYEPGITFAELVSRVRRTALDVYRHDRVPFERVVEVLTPARSLSHHPLFQHAVSLQPQGPGFAPEGVEVGTFDSGAEGSALDIATSFHEEGDRLACVVDFSADLWDQQWGETFAADLTSILRALAEDPARPVDSVELRCPARHTALDDRAATSAEPVARAVSAERERAVEILLGIWRKTLGTDSVTPCQNFFDIGGDSLLGLRVVAAAQQAGYPMRPRHMFQAQTVTELADLLIAETPATSVAGPAAEPDGANGPGAREVPLLPIQSWFLTGPAPEAGHYNYSNLFDVAAEVDEAHLHTAIEATLHHHDAFRLRFDRAATGGWTQSYAATPPTDILRVFDLSAMTPERAASAFDRAVKTCQSSVSLVDGPLVTCALFAMPGRHRKLLVAAHHLIMEPASMSIFVDDLTTACEQLARGQKIELLPQRSTYRDWGRTLGHLAASPEVRSETGYWEAVMEAASSHISVDHPDGRNDVASQRTLADALDGMTTGVLRSRVTAASGATLTEIVLAGAAAGLRPVTDGGPLLIDFETHGREDIVDSIDLSRTVGWFAALFPLALPAATQEASRDLDEAAGVLRGVPRGGLGHGLLTYVSGRLPQRRNQVGVTYLGTVGTADRTGTFFRFAGFPEHDRAPHMTRPHELEVGAMISGDELHYSITYSTNRFSEGRIKDLLAAMRAYFERLTTDVRLLESTR
ncbi:condensation domain-containing protein [Streptomyces sp. NPDC056405]|uniref:condensation domain-containing protein n=1 Tax=Streptomyces sp. NPDC056405 TaxID=3345811 RepID=UPI0035DC4D4B